MDITRGRAVVPPPLVAAAPAPSRLAVARTLGVAGLLAYNWWAPAILVRRALPDADAFFSDLSANGQDHATALQRLDLLGGLLLLCALLLRGPFGRSCHRPEWRWLIGFSMAASVGGLFPFACASTGNAACRQLESQLQLPMHHYLHMVAAVVEFATATAAIVFAHVSSIEDDTPESRLTRRLVVVLVLGYPALAAAFFTRRWGAFIEPMFFVSFTFMVVAYLFTPAGAPVPQTEPGLPSSEPMVRRARPRAAAAAAPGRGSGDAVTRRAPPAGRARAPGSG